MTAANQWTVLAASRGPAPSHITHIGGRRVDDLIAERAYRRGRIDGMARVGLALLGLAVVAWGLGRKG